MPDEKEKENRNMGVWEWEEELWSLRELETPRLVGFEGRKSQE